MYLATYECPHCGKRVSLTEDESILLDAAPAMLKALDGMLSWALSNRGTEHELVTCRTDGDIHHPALDAARMALIRAIG